MGVVTASPLGKICAPTGEIFRAHGKDLADFATSNFCKLRADFKKIWSNCLPFRRKSVFLQREIWI